MSTYKHKLDIQALQINLSGFELTRKKDRTMGRDRDQKVPIKPGDYIVLYNGTLSVVDKAEFEAQFTPVEDALSPTEDAPLFTFANGAGEVSNNTYTRRS
jgi:hypothetical protein